MDSSNTGSYEDGVLKALDVIREAVEQCKNESDYKTGLALMSVYDTLIGELSRNTKRKLH